MTSASYRVGERVALAGARWPWACITWPSASPTSTPSATRTGSCPITGFLRGASDHGVSKSLYTVDPDGNEIELYCTMRPVTSHREGRGGRGHDRQATRLIDQLPPPLLPRRRRHAVAPLAVGRPGPGGRARCARRVAPIRVTFQTLALVPSVVGIGTSPLPLPLSRTHRTVACTRLPRARGSPPTCGFRLGHARIPRSEPSSSCRRDRSGAALTPPCTSFARSPGRGRRWPPSPKAGVLRHQCRWVGGRTDRGRVRGPRRLPEVDLERIGIMGVSVGGSLSLIEAADPTILDQAVARCMRSARTRTWAGSIPSVASHQYRMDVVAATGCPPSSVRQMVLAHAAQVTDGRDHRLPLRGLRRR